MGKRRMKVRFNNLRIAIRSRLHWVQPCIVKQSKYAFDPLVSENSIYHIRSLLLLINCTLACLQSKLIQMLHGSDSTLAPNPGVTVDICDGLTTDQHSSKECAALL